MRKKKEVLEGYFLVANFERPRLWRVGDADVGISLLVVDCFVVLFICEDGGFSLNYSKACNEYYITVVYCRIWNL